MKIFNDILKNYCEERLNEFSLIEEARKDRLKELGEYIISKKSNGEDIKLNFICTHNSRRSHLGQIWAQTAAYWFALEKIWTFSGGTEATAFNKRSVAALIRAGFTIENTNHGKTQNPVYRAKQGEDFPFYNMFSKRYNDPKNPASGYAAIMVCSDADENCPVVFGAEKRFSLTYSDPKEFDNTETESAMYDERCAQIAREMFYVFNFIKLNYCS